MRQAENFTQYKMTRRGQIARTIVAAGTALSLSAFPVCAVAMGQTPDYSACEVTSETSTCVCKVGYHSELGGTYGAVLRDRGAWEAFVSSVSGTTYFDDGTSEVVVPSGLGDYSEEYFESGCLAVAYSDLGSGGYDPSVTNMVVDGNTLTIEWSDNAIDGCFYTCDMSGFVVVVELPADSPVELVSLGAYVAPDESDAENGTTDAGDSREKTPTTHPLSNGLSDDNDWPADEREGIDYEAGTILVGFPEDMTEEDRLAFLAQFPFVDMDSIEAIDSSYVTVSLANGYPVNQAVSDVTDYGTGYGISAQPNFIYRLASAGGTSDGDGGNADEVPVTEESDTTIHTQDPASGTATSDAVAKRAGNKEVTPAGNTTSKATDDNGASSDADKDAQNQKTESGNAESATPLKSTGTTTSPTSASSGTSGTSAQVATAKGQKLPATSDGSVPHRIVAAVLSATSAIVLGTVSRRKPCSSGQR